MRSAERRSTFAGRLATTLVVAAIAAASIATMTGMLLADALIVARVEGSVAASAQVMRVEIDEAPGVADHVEAEARTLGIDGHVAIVQDGIVLHGDGNLAGEYARGCEVVSDRAVQELACAEPLRRPPGALVVVAVPSDRVHGHRLALVLAALAVLVVVSIGAGAVAARSARRFLVPLNRLRRAVVDVDAHAPAAIDLPARSGLEEIDALRNALANLIERLDVELARARRFAASAAHELRTPLASLRAELELASESAPDHDGHERTFARLAGTTARLEALTERLLLLATPQEALTTGHGSAMTQLAEDLALRRFSGEQGRLVVETCEADALVRGDEHLLAAMLDNIVENALKFSSGPVRVRVDELADWVVIDVEDEGPGVPATTERTLFEPFRRGASDRLVPGHGLGLAIAAHVARAYGGDVAFVRDDTVVGARVRIRLPAHHGVNAEASR